MKLLVFAVLLVATVATAEEFKVKSNGTTCAIVKLDGEVSITADEGGNKTEKTLKLSGATLEDASTCTFIKLNLTTKSAQMWFRFDEAKDKWSVKPIIAFIPADVFGDKEVNDTAPVEGDGTTLDEFPKTDSYKCKSSQIFDFQPTSAPETFTYTIAATVSDFQIQSVPKTDDFVKGSECAADKKSNSTDYECKSGDKANIMMEGDFTLVISYNKTEGGKVVNATETIKVPAANATNTKGSVCPAKATKESLKINFFEDTWAINFDFEMDKDKDFFSVTNISVTYTFDSHLPNHTASGSQTVNLPVSVNYLKSETSGYYICNSNLDKNKDGVTLTSKNFKYRAFDDNGKGFNGDVSECASDESSNSIVPIAVGAALAGLVVIVLIAYLIGRKRSRKTGYESV